MANRQVPEIGGLTEVEIAEASLDEIIPNIWRV